MGLSDWINRYIVETRPAEAGPAPAPPAAGQAPAAPPRAAAPPRTAADVLAASAAPPPPADDELEGLLAEARAARAPRAPAADAAPSALAEGPAYAPPPWRRKAAPDAPAGDAAAAGSPAAGSPAAGSPAAGDPLDDGADPPARVEQVYAVAKVGRPPHGFTLERIAAMLADPRLAALDERARAAAVAVLLEGAGVTPAAVVEDAAVRDRALDTFEGFLAQKVTTLEAEVEKENARLTEELERLLASKREAMERNAARVLEKRRELARFRRVKQAEERRLFEVVRHFTAENPVTLSGPPPAPPPVPPPPPEPPPGPPASTELGAADTGKFRAPPRGPAAGPDPYAEMAARLRREREGPPS